MMQIIVEYRCPTWNEVLSASTRHWAVKHKIFDGVKEAMKWAVYQTKNKPDLPFKNKVKISFLVEYAKKPSRRDIDSPCLKPVLDGLVDENVIEDDSIKYISEITLKVKDGTEDKITVTIK